MRYGKAAGLAVGFLGAFALGVGVSPYMRDRPVQHESFQAPVFETGRAVATQPGERPDSRAARSAAPVTRAAEVGEEIPLSSPALHARAKPLLNEGADMALASKDFKSAQQFMTIAHASRNTGIPFVLLRHRVLNEGKSLATAIRESKPEINAPIEADRAVAEARSDLAALTG
jgi:hypothetical protein